MPAPPPLLEPLPPVLLGVLGRLGGMLGVAGRLGGVLGALGLLTGRTCSTTRLITLRIGGLLAAAGAGLATTGAALTGAALATAARFATFLTVRLGAAFFATLRAAERFFAELFFALRFFEPRFAELLRLAFREEDRLREDDFLDFFEDFFLVAMRHSPLQNTGS